jgi:hypothetical protein
MTDDDGRRLAIQSDLRLTSRDVWVNIAADGHHLRVATNDAGLLWTHFKGTHSSWRQTLRQTGAALEQAGLSAELTDPRGSLIRFGDGCGSPAGRLASGGPFVGLGSARVLSRSALRYAWRRIRHATPHP